MTIEAALRSLALSDAAFNGLIGGRWFPLQIDENAPLPAAAYQRINTTRDRAHDGPPGAAVALFQVSIVGPNHLSARQAANALLGVFDHYTGTVGGVVIHSIFQEDDEDEYGRAGENYQIRQDYLVCYDY